jgi:DNA mismatch repair ATPase MutL
MLLFPFEKSINLEEYRAIEENKSILMQLGFIFSLTSERLVIQGSPEIIPENSLDECLNEILTKLAFTTDLKEDLAHILVLTMVKQSVAFFTLKDKTEVFYYVQKLMECKDWTISPSNQKIMLSLPLEKINQLFEKHV